MDMPKTVTMYLNVFRSLTTSKKIPDVAIHGFYKNYTAPEVWSFAVVSIRTMF